MSFSFVFDTSTLLIHAFAVFEKGRCIERIRPAEIPSTDIMGLATLLDRLILQKTIYITPQVLAEFHALAQSRGKLSKEQLLSFLKVYHDALRNIKEEHISKDELLDLKNTRHWQFCFTDTSLISLALLRNLAIITVDRPLKGYCKSINVNAFHPYYDIYLASDHAINLGDSYY